MSSLNVSGQSIAGSNMTLVEAREPRGGIVLLQEAFGVTPYLTTVAQRLADAGRTTVIPHLYHRSGSPAFAYDVDNGNGVDDREPNAEQAAIDAIVPHAALLTERDVMQDVDDGIAVLVGMGIPTSRVAVIGFCLGGSIALYSAGVRELGAAIAFYGAGIRTPHFNVPAFAEVAAHRKTPALGLYGDLDKHIPASDIDALEDLMGLANCPGSVKRWPLAGHGFHCDLRRVYEPQSAEEAWRETLAWLDEHASA